jgi:hypothetical protein
MEKPGTYNKLLIVIQLQFKYELFTTQNIVVSGIFFKFCFVTVVFLDGGWGCQI